MSKKRLSERSQLLRDKWRKHVDAWQASGLTQQAYCDQAGLKLKGFIYWRCKLLKEDRSNQPHDFVPVKVVPDQKVSTNNDAPIQIKLTSGQIVMLPSRLGLEKAAKLIRLVEAQDA